jgi:hypothetical protein
MSEARERSYEWPAGCAHSMVRGPGESSDLSWIDDSTEYGPRRTTNGHMWARISSGPKRGCEVAKQKSSRDMECGEGRWVSRVSSSGKGRVPGVDQAQVYLDGSAHDFPCTGMGIEEGAEVAAHEMGWSKATLMVVYVHT